MAQEFLATPGGNIYPDENTDYDQSESFRKVALNRDSLDAQFARFADLPFRRLILPIGTDLNDVLDARIYQITASAPVLNGPFSGSYTLEVLYMGTSWLVQRATSPGGEVQFRSNVSPVANNWGPWGSHGGGTTGGGAEARTAMEVKGTWTTHAEEDDYLEALAQHREVTRLRLGSTPEGNSIYAFRVGDPAKPAVLILSGQHGNEPGSREGAMMLGRDLAQSTSLLLLDLCVVVIPTMNVDRLLTSRNNANGVNLNRDWVDRAQPETKAVAALFAQYDFIAAVDAHSGGYPREVSIREAEGSAVNALVRERSQRLFDGVTDMYQSEGHAVRRYSDETVQDDPAIFRNGIALLEHIPTLLLEVPAQWANGQYAVSPYWQGTMAALCFREVLQIVWRELSEFVAAKGTGGN